LGTTNLLDPSEICAEVCQTRVPNRLDIFMKLGLNLITMKVIQQRRKFDDFSLPILNCTSTCCLKVEDEKIFEVFSYGIRRHPQSHWWDGPGPNTNWHGFKTT
jgi:hypothetical protein